MTVDSKFRGAFWYRALAREARKNAETHTLHNIKETWLRIAEAWEFLARVQGEPCFCGRPAVGFKLFPDRGSQPACSDHMRELIVQDTLYRSGLKKRH